MEKTYDCITCKKQQLIFFLKKLFGVKFYALFGNFHFKFTFHILRVGIIFIRYAQNRKIGNQINLSVNVSNKTNAKAKADLPEITDKLYHRMANIG